MEGHDDANHSRDQVPMPFNSLMNLHQTLKIKTYQDRLLNRNDRMGITLVRPRCILSTIPLEDPDEQAFLCSHRGETYG